MLDRESLRPDRLYWVIKRNARESDKPTVARLTGELPSLTINVLEDALYPSPRDYDFIAEAKYGELWDATFKGTTFEELTAVAADKLSA